jgi:hypothetical protein
VYGNDLGDVETQVTGLTYSSLSVHSDACLRFADDISYFCFSGAVASEQTACHGDLESYSDDQDLYICGGATLLNATFLEHLDGSLLVSESDLATVKLPKLRNITGGVTIYNNDYLVAVSLPLLEHIGGDLDVTYNHDSSTYAGTYALPALRAVGGQVYFYLPGGREHGVPGKRRRASVLLLQLLLRPECGHVVVGEHRQLPPHKVFPAQ